MPTLMTQPGFVEVRPLDQPDNGGATVVSINGVGVALFNLDGRIFAISDFLRSLRASLASGEVIGTHVSRRQCSWRYDIMSGQMTELPELAIDRFEVRIDDAHVLVATEPSAFDSR